MAALRVGVSCKLRGESVGFLQPARLFCRADRLGLCCFRAVVCPRARRPPRVIMGMPEIL